MEAHNGLIQRIDAVETRSPANRRNNNKNKKVDVSQNSSALSPSGAKFNLNASRVSRRKPGLVRSGGLSDSSNLDQYKDDLQGKSSNLNIIAEAGEGGPSGTN